MGTFERAMPISAPHNFKIIGSASYPKGKNNNLLIYPYFHTTQTTNGLTFTDNGDGSITVKGTATALTHFRMSENTVDSGKLYLPAGTYTLSGCPQVASSSDGYMLEAWDADNNVQIAADIGYGKTFTLTKTTSVRVAIVIQSYATNLNKIFRPQLERGNNVTAFEKYKQQRNTIWLENDNVEEKFLNNFDFSSVRPFLRSNNRNLLCYPFYHKSGHTSAGITFTDNNNGVITANGTATGTSIFRVSYGWERETNCTYLTAGTYTLSGCPAGGADGSKYVVELYKVNPDLTENTRFRIDEGNGCTFTLEDDALVRCSIVIYAGTIAKSLMFKPQLEKGRKATEFVKGDATGQTWFEVNTGDGLKFNALKRNCIEVNLTAARQWNGSAWDDKNMAVYQNNAWRKPE